MNQICDVFSFWCDWNSSMFYLIIDISFSLQYYNLNILFFIVKSYKFNQILHKTKMSWIVFENPQNEIQYWFCQQYKFPWAKKKSFKKYSIFLL